MCAICWRELHIYGKPEQSVGYTNGQDWLCPSCYESFAAPVPENDENDADTGKQ
jgi:hypothetical protein